MADNMTPEQRSRTMSRIRSTNTAIEVLLRRQLHGRGLRYRLHVAGLPGRPDIVFVRERIAVLVDGDFWHGWRFKQWQHKLQPYWREKIAGNMRRDARNRLRLKRAGWRVVRLWEHELRSDLDACVSRVASEVASVRRGMNRQSANRAATPLLRRTTEADPSKRPRPKAARGSTRPNNRL